jgi:hypothetical protein
VMTAFRRAAAPAITGTQQAHGTAAAAPAPPASAAPAAGLAATPSPLSATLAMPATLARFKDSTPLPAAPVGAASERAPEPPDLDALADYVLERLRHELRDGRERLGFLLDDSC